MKKNYTVSVLMPAHNAQKYVQEAIESILTQTYPDFELIIMEDASEDGTDKVICSYTDERIVFLRNEQRKGNYICRNQLARLAKGKYLAMMDADDIAMPDRIKKQLQYLESHPDVLAVGSDRISIPTNVYDEVPHTHEDILLALLKDNAFVHSSLMIRGDVFRQLNGYNTQYYYSADYDLACRLALIGEVVNLPEALVKYRWHPGQISQKYRKEQAEYASIIRQQYQQDFINRFRGEGQAPVSAAETAYSTLGQAIADFTFARYSGNKEYEQQGSDLVETTITGVSAITPFRLQEGLLGIACGLVYLMRNGFVEGEEDEVLAEMDEWMARNLSVLEKGKKIDWLGWLIYFQLRLTAIRSETQLLRVLVMRQNLIFLLDRLADEIREGFLPGNEIKREIEWCHSQRICPEQTARMLATKVLPIEQVIASVREEKITFVIPVRIDSSARERNLDIVLDELSGIDQAEILVMEGDTRSRYRLKKSYTNVQYSFVEDTDPIFYSTKYRNRLLKEAKTSIVGIWDTDIVIPEKQIWDAINAIRDGRAIISFPYNGNFHLLSEEMTGIFEKKRSSEALLEKSQSHPIPCIYHSAGGAFIVNRQEYLAVGGENEHIYGWGPEDVEKVKRIEILGLPVYRAEGPLFHLYHPRNENSRYCNEQQEIKNRNEFLKVCSMTQDELFKYIKTWKTV